MTRAVLLTLLHVCALTLTVAGYFHPTFTIAAVCVWGAVSIGYLSRAWRGAMHRRRVDALCDKVFGKNWRRTDPDIDIKEPSREFLEGLAPLSDEEP